MSGTDVYGNWVIIGPVIYMALMLRIGWFGWSRPRSEGKKAVVAAE